MTRKEYAGYAAGFATLRPRDYRKANGYLFVYPEYKVYGTPNSFISVSRIIGFNEQGLHFEAPQGKYIIPRAHIRKLVLSGFIPVRVK